MTPGRFRTEATGLGGKLRALHGKLPRRWQKIQPLGWLGTVAGAVAAIGIVVGIVLCSPSRSVAPGSGARPVDADAKSEPRPTDAQIEQAVADGSEAIERLLVERPGDPRLLRALARSYIEANRADKALGAYKSLAAVDPALLEDREDRANMVLLCKVESTSDAAYAMLESDLGSRGIDLLYWLAYESDAGRPYRARAEYALDKRTVRAKASPALSIALDLRAAATCEQKRALLERARVDGDRRARRLLMELRTTRGCGFLQLGECWTCLRQDSQLDDAIRAIEGRSASPPDAAAPALPGDAAAPAPPGDAAAPALPGDAAAPSPTR